LLPVIESKKQTVILKSPKDLSKIKVKNLCKIDKENIDLNSPLRKPTVRLP